MIHSEMGKRNKIKKRRPFKGKCDGETTRKKSHLIHSTLSQTKEKSVDGNVTDEDNIHPLHLLLSTFAKSSSAVTNSNSSIELSKNRTSVNNHVLLEGETNKNSLDHIHFSDVYTIEDANSSDKTDSSEIMKDNSEEMEETDILSTEIPDDEDVEKQSYEESVDHFHIHYNYDLDSTVLESLTCTPVKVKKIEKYWPNLGNLCIEIPLAEKVQRENELKKGLLENEKMCPKHSEVPDLIETLNWDKLCVKTQIQSNISNASKKHCGQDLTAFQTEIFSIINNYQDMFYPERNISNGEQIRFTYCLHVVNHIVKSRLKILHHNEKVLKREDGQILDEYRDQGLVRPKVLILVPFRESCLRIVRMICSIMISEDKGNIINKFRFQKEFSGSELVIPKINSKPEDYEHLFKGNIDDNFKIGLCITKKSVKLFTDFYSSDIIIASPLGLRMVIGADGDKKRDFDFLASLEVLIIDQAEVFLMQNWDHLLLVFDHLHIQPKESHGTDFSRIRSWVLNGWSKFYRQTLIFSSIITPELNALFSRRCHNYSGKIRILNPTECGSISLVVSQLSHVFHKFKAESVQDACEARFTFFTEKILPEYKDPSLTGILIYVPSYFDYVKIRNYLKREDYNFVQICEYSKDARIARARDKFFHGEARFLLYTERFHFFRRIKLKGIRHAIFYQLPSHPHFYSELCNSMKVLDGSRRLENNDCNSSVTVLYCNYDVHQLSAIVKTSRASTLLKSEKDVHLFTTG